jgi:glutamate dehydrogenase (NAD(P)+)
MSASSLSASFKSDAFPFVDEFGPAKIVYASTPGVGLEAIVVIDNIAAGPAIGGVRMAPDVGVEECFRLARAMTLKNAACGLRHGGGKSVIFGDPAMPPQEKEQLIRAFAKAIEPLTDYIPGPDMGTNETCMAYVHDEIGRAVGLPAELGGVPLDEIGATGYGVAIAAEAAAPFAGLKLQGARVVVEGFGAVGRHAARFLSRKGAILVGASDSRGAIYNAGGLDIDALAQIRSEGCSVASHARGDALAPDALLVAPCDIFIPAARPDVLRADNVGGLQCKLVVQGANIPATAEAERIMFERGIVSAPDFIANAGGVICASVEYAGGDEKAAFAAIEEKISRNMQEIVARASSTRVSLRDAATALVHERLRKMMATQRWR